MSLESRTILNQSRHSTALGSVDACRLHKGVLYMPSKSLPDYEPAGFFVLRNPVLPLERLAGLVSSNGTAEPVSQREMGETSSIPEAQVDPSEILLQDLEAKDAVELASPEFLGVLESSRTVGGSASKLSDAARRYLLRMACRATPFGAFASTSLGEFGRLTDLAPPPLSRLHVQLDAQAEYAICCILLADEELLAATPVSSNTTLYRVDDEWRYVERHTTGGSAEYTFVLSSAKDNSQLSAVIEKAKLGTPASALVALLTDRGYGSETAKAFIVALIHAQILVSSLMPLTVGRGTLDSWLELIREHVPQSRWEPLLSSISNAVEAANTAGSMGKHVEIHQVSAALEGIGVAPHPGRVLQVDLYREGSTPQLSMDIADKLLTGVRGICALNPGSTRSEHLTRLKQEFLRRYGDRDVPLLHLFDPTLGLGSPIANTGLMPPTTQLARLREREAFALTPPQQFLLERQAMAAREGSHEIELHPRDIAQLERMGSSSLPLSFSVLASLYRVASTGQQSSEGVLIHLRSYVGGSPAALYGRFLHGHPKLMEALRGLTNRESALCSDCILAEVDFASGPRSPNVSRRPQLMAYDIPVIGPGDPTAGVTLSLSDLHVRVSDGAFLLWSESLGKRVRPRYSCMLGVNPGRDLALYAFLVALQADEHLDYSGQEFIWGPLWRLPWLPRLRTQDVILSRETWRISPELLSAHEGSQLDRLKATLGQLRVPTHCVLSELDRELPLSLEEDWSLREILRSIRKTGVARLHESLGASADPVSVSSVGSFNNEIIVPFLRDRTPPAPLSQGSPQPCLKRHPHTSGRSGPGSEWVYVKAYMRPGTMDDILTVVLYPLCNKLLNAQRIRKWYFLRYSDSDDHLRLRLQAEDRSNWSTLAEEVLAALLGHGRDVGIRCELGTYEYETQRYGGHEALALSEDIFHLDSELVVRQLEKKGLGEQRHSWFLGTIGVLNGFLRALCFAPEERERLVRHTLERYCQNWPPVTRSGAKVLHGKYFREVARRSELRLLSNDALDGDEVDETCSTLLRQIRPVALAARCAIGKEGLISIEDWGGAMAHMHCNRLFESAIIENELISYEVLARIYRSRREQGLQ